MGPKDKNGFQYTYIDKKGDIVLKQTLEDVKKHGTFEPFTNYSLGFTVNYILNTRLKILSKKDFYRGLWCQRGVPVVQAVARPSF